QVVLASSVNLEWLKNVSGTAWVSTTESGDALTGAPGVEQFRTVHERHPENPHLELSCGRVTRMIGHRNNQVEAKEHLTQERNYQANTKVISTQKDLDQILFSSM